MEVYRLEEGRYQRLSANERSHYPISPMGVELGIWQGEYENMTLPCLRWWDNQGNLLLTGREQAQQERQRADRLAERLCQLGVNLMRFDKEVGGIGERSLLTLSQIRHNQIIEFNSI